MKGLVFFTCLGAGVLSLAAPSPALALANRVFVSARSGNNASSCDNVKTPCLTFAGAVAQLNPNGTAIVLDSGGYGPVTITQGVTIEAPAGVTAFIHPPSGDAITVNAPGATVTLRGLSLSVGTNMGITVLSVGTLNVENCFITGFANYGILIVSGGRFNVKGTDITGCAVGLNVGNVAGVARILIDHCHLDGNFTGFEAQTGSPGGSIASASHTTANGNLGNGWRCGDVTTGKDVLDLEFCTASENGQDGLVAGSGNPTSAVRYSNCVFANNGGFGVQVLNAGSAQTRGNNTIVGNVGGATSGGVSSFSPI